jgi:hypothetical protein
MLKSLNNGLAAEEGVPAGICEVGCSKVAVVKKNPFGLVDPYRSINREMQRRRKPSILSSAWLSYQSKVLLLHGEAASYDGPLARATNAASTIRGGKAGGGESVSQSLARSPMSSWSLPCDAPRDGSMRTCSVAQSALAGCIMNSAPPTTKDFLFR